MPGGSFFALAGLIKIDVGLRQLPELPRLFEDQLCVLVRELPAALGAMVLRTSCSPGVGFGLVMFF
jgi:hypothetical protein